MNAENEVQENGEARFPVAWLVIGIAGVVLLALLTLGVGYAIGRARGKTSAGQAAAAKRKVKHWTCSMHPQIERPGPGQCPLCGMDLIPVYAGGDEDEGERTLSMSEASRKLAEIQWTSVERKFVEAEINLVGKVDYDETRVKHITAWFPGRLDKLYVDYTGIPVKKGDHLVSVYSPQLLAAQEELLQAKRAYSDARKSKSEFMLRSSKATLEATREKLRLWGLSEEQVASIEKSGRTRDHMTVYSPMAGIVIKKHLNQGAYVKTGARIYTIVDLSRVWINLDAYESDLQWIRYGQDVEFRVESYPGETFRGMITFIHPVLNARTRTVKLRVVADNSKGKLKPGMFVHARVKPRVAAGGKVMDPRLAGKWICPMHPEVIKEKPGKCDVCGMPLVKTEQLGYVAAKKTNAPLVIPASAPLLTGKRAVVYVKVPGAKRPTFEGREVLLGPRAGNYYIVRKGLEENEEVVTKGAFKIDSALQIEAKPSMMSPPAGAASPEKKGPKDPADVKALGAPAEFRAQLSKVVAAYLELQKALAGDDPKLAAKAAASLEKKLTTVDMKLLKGKAHMAWMKDAKALADTAGKVAKSGKLKEQRESFALLSEGLAAAVRRFGLPPEDSLFLLKCPMAFNNRGAWWLQDVEEVRNPYFGAAMLKCGEVVAPLRKPGGKKAKTKGPHHGH